MKRYVQRILQWLGLSVSPTWGSSLILGWGTKSPQASQCGKKKKKKRCAPKVHCRIIYNSQDTEAT